MKKIVTKTEENGAKCLASIYFAKTEAFSGALIYLGTSNLILNSTLHDQVIDLIFDKDLLTVFESQV